MKPSHTDIDATDLEPAPVLLGVMNDTKWEALRLAMLEMTPRPGWRTCSLPQRYVSTWDHEWFYHFCAGGYGDIEWLDIRPHNAAQHDAIRVTLKAIHLPGQETAEGFRVIGFIAPGCPVEYI